MYTIVKLKQVLFHDTATFIFYDFKDSDSILKTLFSIHKCYLICNTIIILSVNTFDKHIISLTLHEHTAMN